MLNWYEVDTKKLHSFKREENNRFIELTKASFAFCPVKTIAKIFQNLTQFIVAAPTKTFISLFQSPGSIIIVAIQISFKFSEITFPCNTQFIVEDAFCL